MGDIYNSLPLKTYSLRGFNEEAQVLLYDEQEYDRGKSLHFVLTGEEADGHQVVIDPLRNYLRQDQPVTVMRDYDSVLGISDEIAVRCHLALSPVSNQTDALTSSVHLEHKIQKGQEVLSVPYHRIPNTKLAIWGTRNSIHVFFPKLALGGRTSPFLSDDELREFYDLGLRPYAQTFLVDQHSDWPPSYDSEVFRARKSSGQRAFRTVVLPGWLLDDFGTNLREQLEGNGVDWAEGLFFMHTIRGIKHSTQHTKCRASAEYAFARMLEEAHFPYAVVDGLAEPQGSWWVDVGLEFTSQEEECLQWMTASHSNVVQNALEIDELHARRITKLGSSKYSRDLASHLPAVSGCRIEPGALAKGRYEAVYLQMYTTDKSVTYQASGYQKAKAITMKEAMGGGQSYVKNLFKAYDEASRQTPSNTRIEMRVPWQFAKEALIHIDEAVFLESTLSFSKDEWWTFKAIRLVALGKVLRDQALGARKFRVRPEALLLTAAATWLINSLHQRPDDGPSSRNLMKAALPVTEEEDDDTVLAYAPRNGQAGGGGDVQEEEESDDELDRGTPCYPYGVIFLRRIMPGEIPVPTEGGETPPRPVPRMRIGGPLLSPSAFQFYFKASPEEIRHAYYTVGTAPKGQTNPRRVSNRARCTKSYVKPPGAPEPAIFNLAAAGYSLPPPPIDDGSDNEDGSANEGGITGGNIDDVASKIWRQFLLDMANKAPNPKRAGRDSYSKLTHAERAAVGEDHYKTRALSELWNACYWKVANTAEWNRAFDNLFPTQPHVTSSRVQNYRQCLYYTTWRELEADLADSPEDLAGIRRAFKRKIDKLYWLPDAYPDKMWPTNLPASSAKRFKRFPEGSNGPAPRILYRVAPDASN